MSVLINDAVVDFVTQAYENYTNNQGPYVPPPPDTGATGGVAPPDPGKGGLGGSVNLFGMNIPIIVIGVVGYLIMTKKIRI